MSAAKQRRKVRRKGLADEVQARVDRGADAAEEIHKKVLDLPFEVLERNGVMQSAVKDLREIQDQAIGAVYDVVRGINHSLTGLAKDVLRPGPAKKRGARRAKPKKRAARESQAA